MLRVSIDAFSGRPNPSWVVDGSDADDLLAEISRHRGVLTDLNGGYSGLGFRGAEIELLSDETATAYDLPAEFKVGGGGSQDDGTSFDLAERLIRSMRKYAPSSSRTDSPVPLDQDLENYLLGLLKLRAPVGADSQLDGAAPAATPADVTCLIERGQFNPGFWNTPSVQPYNNCYNYATNYRTNTFAQPGKGAGSQYTALSCPEVSRAALADGCHVRFNCFPDAEKPRWLMAMVVAPGYDYHWYRLQKDGFWGHKPGSTAARNTDNNGSIISNPETCARGPYTHFCGYFYSCKSQQTRIR